MKAPAKTEAPKKLGSRPGIRHAYESALVAAARLQSFATGKTGFDFGPMETKQEVLAVQDLAVFAINARRLLEMTIGLKAIENVSIKAGYDEKIGALAFTRILNVLVHHRSLDIYRTDRLFQAAKVGFKIELVYSIKPKVIPCLIAAVSDQGRHAMFELEALVNVFQDEVLTPVIDHCTEQQFYLDDIFPD